jgi:hypothetical protein
MSVPIRDDWQDLAPKRAVTGVPRLPQGPKHLAAVPGVADGAVDGGTNGAFVGDGDEDADAGQLEGVATGQTEVSEPDDRAMPGQTVGTGPPGRVGGDRRREWGTGPSAVEALRLRREPAVAWPKQFSTLPAALVERLSDAEMALFDTLGRKISRSRITLAAVERLFADGDPVADAADWGGRDDEAPTRDHSFRLPPTIHTSLRRASLQLMRKDEQRTVSHLVGLALERYLDDLAAELGPIRPVGGGEGVSDQA